MSSKQELSTPSHGEVLFTMSRSQGISTSAKNTSSIIDENQVFNLNNTEDTVLCVLWKHGKFGAAHFNIYTKHLYVQNDVLDSQPYFAYTRSLLQNFNLKHLITIGAPCDQYVKFLIDFLTHGDDETTINSDSIRKVPPNMSLVPFPEYSFATCKLKIYSLNLPSMPEQCSETERELYFQSLINFDSKMSIYALGALIKFVERSWGHLLEPNSLEPLNFLHVNRVSIDDRVFINRSTFKAIQVFQKRTHDASFKHGKDSAIREGTSVFKLFSQYCQSKLGYQCLRKMLVNPSNNIAELNKRLDFIDFATQHTNSEFIQSLQCQIKHIYDVDMILSKIQNSRGSGSDWELLYKTIYHTLHINEMCAPHKNKIALFDELDSAITADLYGLEKCTSNALDFSTSSHKFRPVIKYGLDEELDKKKLRRQDIGKHLTAAANFSVSQLPEFLDECSIVHIPEMGHLLAIKKPPNQNDSDQMEQLGYHFMFEIHGTYHYRNSLCKELDKHLGHIHDEILAHENRILQRLAGFILKFNKNIREPLKSIALIDCLISMGKVAKEKNYVRPVLNENNKIEIQEGRHLLSELYFDNYVPNDLYSGGQHDRVKIITGPNMSGKSVFLKQSTLLIYLAHVGSYVPAKSASICIMRSINSRLHATESASIRLSAFMIDLAEMSKAMECSYPNSLIVIDEFGCSTTGADGMVLLASALKRFLDLGEACPHILVSTHFQEVIKHLPESSLVHCLRMDHAIDNEHRVVSLYKTVEGVCKSFAFDVALAAGLNKRIVDRAKEIYDAIQNNKPIYPPQSVNRRNNSPKSKSHFVNIDIPCLDE